MRSRKKADPEMMIGMMFSLAAVMAEVFIAAMFKVKYSPATAVGYDGLAQIHRFLGIKLAEAVAIPVTIVAVSVIASLIYRAANGSAGRRRWSPLYLVAAAIAFSYIMFQPKRSGYDLQQNENGYSGIPIVRLAKLYSDCGKDLNEKEVRSVGFDTYSMADEDYSYSSGTGRTSRRVTVTEYSLTCGSERVQIESYDKAAIKMQLSAEGTHIAEFYTHSGFLASLDGAGLPAGDVEELFTISADGDKVVMSTTENKERSEDLTLILESGGEYKGEIPITNGETELSLPKMNKGDRCYLQMTRDGKPVRVSNIILF